MSLLLQECSKQGLLSEANMNNLIDKRYSRTKVWETPRSGAGAPGFGGEHGGAAVLTLGDCNWDVVAWGVGMLLLGQVGYRQSLSPWRGSWWWPETVAVPWGCQWVEGGRQGDGFLHTGPSLGSPRAADKENSPSLKSAENANIQPNPGLILRAEPTVTNILKVSALLQPCWAGWAQPWSPLPAASV